MRRRNTPGVGHWLTAISLLAPIIERVADYINGGDEPPELKTLPQPLRSEIELARAKARTR